jgi:hypothetical protein
MLISGVIQAGAGIVQGVTGAIQNAKANKIMRNTQRPTYNIPSEIRANQNIAESRAGQGMSDAARTAQEQANERNLTAATGSILKGGGSVNNIGLLYGNSTDATQRMAMIDDEMRAKNIENLIEQNRQMADYKDKKWQVDVWAPYADKMQAAAALKKQGSDNMWKGINTVGSAASNYLMGEEYKDEINSVYGRPETASPMLSRPNQAIEAPVPMGETGWKPVPEQWEEGPHLGRTGAIPSTDPYGRIRSQYPGLIYGNIYSGG